jgi:hypothetical protein
MDDLLLDIINIREYVLYAEILEISGAERGQHANDADLLLACIWRVRPLASAAHGAPLANRTAIETSIRLPSATENAIWSGIGLRPANRQSLVPGLSDILSGRSDLPA